MKKELLSYFYSYSNIRVRLQFQVVMQCAPLLKHMKVSNLVMLSQNSCAYLKEVFQGTNIRYRILYTSHDRCLVLFYRKDELERHLASYEVLDFLEEFGYAKRSLSELLARLKDRSQAFSNHEADFPHEIGVFLEYPTEDIRGFILNGGKRYLCCGYWKVYHNPSRAQKIFRAYDMAKNCAVNEFLTGMSIREISEN